MDKNLTLDRVEHIMELFEEDDLKSFLECFQGIYLDSEEIGELIEHSESNQYEYYSNNFGYRGRTW